MNFYFYDHLYLSFDQSYPAHLPLDGNIQIGNISQTEVDQPLELVLAQVILEALTSEFFPLFHGQKAVFRKAIDALVNYSLSNLFCNFHNI